ncbi:unnamed protein product [Bursaphelenchus okinawaensis]|uniref:Uncharacterized protein n=1 Tax=Bursaphelenchus okinawaensis TaxID=465554 RepID=A0A811K4Y1_9BILA|nr:unnamed protein product [Bursaphelenchus okinawaensis]CAG9091422.1 unnamed protein product [Bursaphelenchus okinawaensis]
MTDPYYCLRCSSIAIGVYNLLYCLIQFGILGWQTHVVKTFQWEYENRQLPPTHAIDGFQARFPGLYAIYTETPERRKINALFVIVLLCIGCNLLHLFTTVSMLYGVIKRNHSFICIWFFTGAPLIILTTAYAILWWSGDIFNEQLTASVAEFVFSLAINGPCYIVVLMYYLRITGSLTSDKIGRGQQKRDKDLPKDVPSFYPKMPKDPPYEMKRKLRRRESRSPLRPQSEPRGRYGGGTGQSNQYMHDQYQRGRNQYPAGQFQYQQGLQNYINNQQTRPPYQYPNKDYPAQSVPLGLPQPDPYPRPQHRTIEQQQYPNQSQLQYPNQSKNLQQYQQKYQQNLPKYREESASQLIDRSSRRKSSRQSRRSTGRSRATSAGPSFTPNFKRKSPQRVSFNNRPRVYQRTPSDSLSNGPKLEIQTVI